MLVWYIIYMVLDIEPEEAHLVEEIGYKVSEVKTTPSTIRVKLARPDSADSKKVISMSSDKAETVEYIKDGQVVEEPHALKRVKDRIESELRSVERSSEHEFESYDLLKDREKILEACEQVREEYLDDR